MSYTSWAAVAGGAPVALPVRAHLKKVPSGIEASEVALLDAIGLREFLEAAQVLRDRAILEFEAALAG